MRVVRRILLAAGVVVGGILYVWLAAVRAVPGVRRRKQATRAARRAGTASPGASGAARRDAR